MARKKLKPLKSKAKSHSESALDWSKSFIEYLRSEAHLAENSVVAYQRDLRRFHQWLDGKSIPRLTIGDLGDFAAWLAEQSPLTLAAATNTLPVEN